MVTTQKTATYPRHLVLKPALQRNRAFERCFVAVSLDRPPSSAGLIRRTQGMHEGEAKPDGQAEAGSSTGSRGRRSRYSGRGRGPGQGSGFGRGGRQQGTSLQINGVPNSSVVVSGAGVAVILKADQSTGRQVQGIIQDVLGRGDHPRGIKVRLEDGRVGRVQAMVVQSFAGEVAAGIHDQVRNREAAKLSESRSTTIAGRLDQGLDMRKDGYDYADANSSERGTSLLDYVRPARKSARRSAVATRSLKEETEEMDQPVECPVCHQYEGDSVAVALHVNGHFE